MNVNQEQQNEKSQEESEKLVRNFYKKALKVYDNLKTLVRKEKGYSGLLNDDRIEKVSSLLDNFKEKYTQKLN